MKIKTNTTFFQLSKIFLLMGSLCLLFSCNSKSESQEMNAKPMEITAKKISGRPNYQAICYGG